MVMFTNLSKKEKKELIKKIKNKKELKSLDNSFIEKLLLNEDINLNFRSREFKEFLKRIRKRLHDIYGVFSLGDKWKLLNGLKKNPSLENHRKILRLHRSTKERLDCYEEIYRKIGKIDSLLDLGCGLNPFSYPWMNVKKYIASELSKEDCEFIKEYFKIMNINGKVVKYNLLENNKYLEADVCFLFKLLDSLEELEKGISEKLLRRLKCKKIIVSFPTKTLSGKKLNKRRLKWFENLIKNYEIFEIENEIFYIIER